MLRFRLLLLAGLLPAALVAPAQTTPALPPTAAPPLPAAPADWLLRELEASPVLRQHHAGLQLSYVATGQSLLSWHADKYFVPASTHKLLTLYAALRILGDSVPSLRYQVRGDTLLVRGTGDPTLLHGDVPSARAYQFMQRWPGPLRLAPTPYAESAYGPGWPWDDYPYYFQPERGGFPIYGHTVRFYARQPGRAPVVQPRWFRPLVQAAPAGATSPDHVLREPEANRYTWFAAPRAWVDESPFRTSPALLLTLLRDTLHRDVQPGRWRPQPGSPGRTLYGLPVDSLLRRMVRVSDNLLAEQTLLLCAAQLGHDTLSAARVMAHVRRQGWLRPLPDSVAWVDGSGLSRLNLNTPRNQVALLRQLHQLVPEPRLLSLLAAGGGQGTLRRAYRSPDKKPWLWGKTGTLSNNHNLCGFVRTRSGQLLAFSFLNNNHLAGTEAVRREMERLLTLVRERL
ncbi:D-alanyl-D-alanine carboxypeptidase/D-alanyl-D-alanine-endopeptidase [Hymenobacter sp. B81]|uniref:D-alanyl-D-alanine carboxypeptidase/D-alanyl-D-alanine-endopeptidase n=1 Tax=Hymenobacter sp. B81 TaxID=3344878 RepID=UPI0037DC0ABA